MEKRWIIKEAGEIHKVSALVNELGVNPVIANLLTQRGISNFEEARKFFRPRLTDLHDPFLMKDMDKAVNRIEQAILKGEKIIVYGDYDVDGTTSVALVYSFLKKNDCPPKWGF